MSDTKQNEMRGLLRSALANGVVAKEVGVHIDTIRRWRRRLEAEGQIEKFERRVVIREGKPQMMTTFRIGQHKALRACGVMPVAGAG